MTTAFYFSRSDGLGVVDRIRGHGRRLRGFVALVVEGAAVARQRRQLLSLDDRALNDIGISRADANMEAMRGFWDRGKQGN